MATNQPNVTSEETEAVDKPPRWLVATVIILGLAIIGMLVLMVVKIMAGGSDDATDLPKGSLIDLQTQQADLVGVLQQGPYLKEASISRPEGARLDSVEVYGHEMVMHFRLADGGDLVIVLNRVTGETSRVIVP